jgi:hypothetical protein
MRALFLNIILTYCFQIQKKGIDRLIENAHTLDFRRKELFLMLINRLLNLFIQTWRHRVGKVLYKTCFCWSLINKDRSLPQILFYVPNPYNIF